MAKATQSYFTLWSSKLKYPLVKQVTQIFHINISHTNTLQFNLMFLWPCIMN